MTQRLPFERVVVFGLLAAGAVVTLVGCPPGKLNNGGTATKFEIVVVSGTDDTAAHSTNQSFTVSATCQPGQQLVGGGYRLLNDGGAKRTMVVVEGSFPSSSTTWSVQARNPDNGTYVEDGHVLVIALAYCVVAPGYDLDIEIANSGEQAIGKTTATTIEARCTQTGNLALSGGFRTTTLPVFKEPGGATHSAYWPGLLGTGIVATGPSVPDASHSAMGWHVTQFYTPASNLTAPKPDVKTTVFAICARKSINTQAYRIAEVAGPSTASPTATASCGVGEFAVGGGYSGFALPTASDDTPEVEANSASHSSYAFEGWQVVGISTVATRASALCVRIPSI